MRILLCGFSLLCASGAAAGTLSPSWIGAATGSWTESSWSILGSGDPHPNNNGATGNTYRVTIDSAALSLSSLAVNLQLESLALGSAASVSLGAGTRTVSLGSATNHGTVQTTGSGGLTLDLLPGKGDFSPGGTLANPGLLKASGGSLAVRNASILNGASGRLQATGGGSLSLAEVDVFGGSVEVGDASGLAISGTNFFSGVGLLNYGSLDLLGQLTALDPVAWSNAGVFHVRPGGGLSVNGSLLNSGTVLLSSGADGSGQMLLNGDLTLTGNGILSLQGGQIQSNAGTENLLNQSAIAGNGVIMGAVQNQGSITASGGTLHLTSVDNSAGLLQVDPGAQLSIYNLSQFVFGEDMGPGTLTGGMYLVNGTATAPGVLAIDSASIRVNQAAVVLAGPGARIEDGFGGNALSPFAVNDAAGSFYLIDGATFSAAGDFLNLGLIDVGSGSSFSSPGAFIQSGGLTQVDGTLEANSVSIQGGSLTGSGTVRGDLTVGSGGSFSPGNSPGTMNVAGNFTLGSGSTFDLEIDTLLDAYDRLIVDGNVDLDGLIRVALSGPVVSGSIFEWLQYTGTLTGNWSYDLPALAGGLHWSEVRGGNFLALSVLEGSGGSTASTPEPGALLLLVSGLAAVSAIRARGRKV